MVKLAILFAAGLAGLTGFVSADSCVNNRNYCGFGLLRKGNYYQNIIDELNRVRQPTDDADIQQSLFHCEEHGDISFVTFCGTCHDGPTGKDASC
ncbi:hypothetical protein MMC22_005803 [Lobaria immixta]|nr:hypothetical protein [Lobaria immixta]